MCLSGISARLCWSLRGLQRTDTICETAADIHESAGEHGASQRRSGMGGALGGAFKTDSKL